ncbi:DUF7527 domain-containing protein [Halovenus marina]|uniref:DUF7527 domain-containing protein n=1 Tax=Halovenus marina TaxID=3396621 RepID=UPI003F57C14D
MSTRVADRVEDWDRRSFEGGYRALQDLAEQSFSGVIRAGGGELYMTRGVCVGLLSGSIEDFENAEGTVYESPAESLPLLAVMQERAGEQRAQYYSEKTSISEVDSTLSDGGFTGFIELSENVLSGDYYLVYHAGTSMSVAFVGESERLLDGDEAFERANGEVGIYQVYQVDIDPIEIPEPSEPEASTPAPADTPDTGTEDEGEEQSSPAGTAPDEPDAETASQGGGTVATTADTTETESAEATATDSEPTTGDPSTNDSTGDEESTVTARDEPDAGSDDGADHSTATDRADTAVSEPVEAAETDEPTATEKPAETERSAAEVNESTESETAQSADDSGRASGQPATKAGRSTDSGASQPATKAGESAQPAPTADQPTRQDRDQSETTTPRTTQPTGGVETADATGNQPRSQYTSQSSSTTASLEQRAIPSLDPTRTMETSQRQSSRTDPLAADTQSGRQPEPTEPVDASVTEPEPSDQTQRNTAQSESTDETAPADERTPQAESKAGEEPPEEGTAQSVDSERVETLEDELESREAEIERLETELERTSGERDDLEDDLEELRAERDELEEQVETLEGQLQQLESELGAATDAEQRLTPGEALSGTDLFVRYHSKGDATLAKAHGSGVRKEDVNDNLRLETHTTFEKSNVAVGGKTFDEFLESTVEYQFVNWVVRELLFEIRSTGHETALKDLYDALPDVDRAELSGVVDVVYTEGGQETRTQESFDVVLRDRMGNPLLVANLNDSREAATESMMERLITSAERVGQSKEEFAAAFMVTQSFFEPGALETTSGATQGGLLSRNKRKSFVNISRKRGYHLCLVEARNQNFHVTVPEL